MTSVRPLFIVGCPRSGTALLRDLIRSHPAFEIPGESHFIPALYHGWPDPLSERTARRLARRILALRWVRAWGLELRPGDFAGCRTYAELVARLYGACAARAGKPRWGDKTPEYVLDVPALRRLFPDCRVIHIHRDGRDVWRSWRAIAVGPANVYAAATRWDRFVTAGQNAAKREPGACMQVGYEALLAQPEATLRAVCAFLDEPFRAAMLQPEAPPPGAARDLPGAIVRSNTERWRTDLSPDERRVFEAVAGPTLAALGYEVEGDRVTIGWSARARWSVADAAQWISRRTLADGRITVRPHLASLVIPWARLRARLGLGRRVP
ncbi:MAG: sulfotransferase family protein [Gemmatimonadales bacterium]